jgi:hypothetical protein
VGEFSLVDLVGGTGIEPVTSSVSGNASCCLDVADYRLVAARNANSKAAWG